MDSSSNTSSPSTSVPLIAVDTNIISGIVKGDLKPEYANAVSRILTDFVSPGRVTVGASTHVLNELERIPDQFRKEHVDEYNSLMSLPKRSDVTWINPSSTGEVVEHPRFKALRKLLDEDDAILIHHLIDRAPDHPWACFMTADEGTILNRRQPIESQYPIRVQNPSEVLSNLSTL